MRIARMILALPLLALSLASAETQIEAKDPFIKEGICEAPEKHREMAPASRPCPGCREDIDTFDLKLCRKCLKTKGLCTNCGGIAPELHSCEFRRRPMCEACGDHEINGACSVCVTCAKKRDVCPVCLKHPFPWPKDPLVKDGVCEKGCAISAEMPRSKCEACGEHRRSHSAKICAPCAEKRGVCPTCLKSVPKKKGEDDAARCRCGIRTADWRAGGTCAKCSAGIDRRDKLCEPCAKAAGVCGGCGLRKGEVK